MFNYVKLSQTQEILPRDSMLILSMRPIITQIKPYLLSITTTLDGKQMFASFKVIILIMALIVMHRRKHIVQHRRNQMLSATRNKKSLDLTVERNLKEHLPKHRHGTTSTRQLMKSQTNCYLIPMTSETLMDLTLPTLLEINNHVVHAIPYPSPRLLNQD